jgi:hypothetical protein
VKPEVTVVTVHGSVVPGVTMETEPGAPPLAVQIREPSKAIAIGEFPRLVATGVTAPAACAGSIR